MPAPTNLTPARGTPVYSLTDALGIVREVADQATINATIDAGGDLAADMGHGGTRITPPFPAKVQCFEIRSCWQKTNPPPAMGASRGIFWKCHAVEVVYWLDANSHTHWAPQDECGAVADVYDIFWAVRGLCCEGSSAGSCSDTEPCDASTWQDGLYPKAGEGQWVWCVFDYSADVWRVLDAFDPIVAFRLREPLTGCGSACADILSFGCDDIVGSSSAVGTGSSCSCPEDNARGSITVHDTLGISNQTFRQYRWTGANWEYDRVVPVGTNGWAKYCADDGKFHVISYGKCEPCVCGSSSSSGSPSHSASGSPASSSSSQCVTPESLGWPPAPAGGPWQLVVRDGCVAYEPYCCGSSSGSGGCCDGLVVDLMGWGFTQPPAPPEYQVSQTSGASPLCAWTMHDPNQPGYSDMSIAVTKNGSGHYIVTASATKWIVPEDPENVLNVTLHWTVDLGTDASLADCRTWSDLELECVENPGCYIHLTGS